MNRPVGRETPVRLGIVPPRRAPMSVYLPSQDVRVEVERHPRLFDQMWRENQLWVAFELSVQSMVPAED